MSLPASQQRVLDTIEDTLQRREPRLASMFAIFTRLTRNEGMPRTEVLVTVPWWSARRIRARVPGRGLLLIALSVALVVSAIFVGISGSAPACTLVAFRASMTVQTQQAGQNHVRSCPAVPGTKSMGVGHGP